MNLSAKGRYAVTALADIALHGGEGMVPLADIADRQGLPLSYLEQLFIRLRRANIVESARGPAGGYRLAREAEDLPISDIMRAVDERLRATRCHGAIGVGCSGSRACCLTHDLWETLSAHVYLLLNRTTLADVVEKRFTPCPAVPDFSPLLDAEEAFA